MDVKYYNPAGFDFTSLKEKGDVVEDKFITLFNATPKFSAYTCYGNKEYFQIHTDITNKLLEIYKPKLEKYISDGMTNIEAISTYFDKTFHCDCIITNRKDDNISMVDVKGIKKKSRGDFNKSYSDIQWLEYVNEFGYDGWVKPESWKFNKLNLNTKVNYEYVAFETMDEWLICDKKTLTFFANELFIKHANTITTECPKNCYIIYNRIYNNIKNKVLKPESARKAQLMMVPNEDLRKIATFILKKNI